MRNRSNLYAVVRFISGDTIGMMDAQIVGVYSTLESAENMTGVYNQQVKDGKLPKEFRFETQVTVYYDE